MTEGDGQSCVGIHQCRHHKTSSVPLLETERFIRLLNDKRQQLLPPEKREW